MSFDHILVIGFGGPAQPSEVRPYLENVTRGIAIPEERLNQVIHHYEVVGGYSPYNEYTFRLFNKLHEALIRGGVSLPMFIGMRNWRPLLQDVISEIHQKGFKRGLGVILAPHRSDASYEKYIRNVEEAKEKAGATALEYQYLTSWFNHEGFVQAQAEEVQKILQGIPFSEYDSIGFIFSAHSIPVEMAQKSNYAEEVNVSSRLVAEKIGISGWQVAWQSRSGSPRQPWLSPDILEIIPQLRAQGKKTIVIIPIGFLCDHVEVLYDLDIEAKTETERNGMNYLRASTVMDHPKFVAMLTQLISASIQRPVKS